MFAFVEGVVLPDFRANVIKRFMLFINDFNLPFREPFNCRSKKLESKGFLICLNRRNICLVLAWGRLFNLILTDTPHFCSFAEVRSIEEGVKVCAHSARLKSWGRLAHFILWFDWIEKGIIFARSDFWFGIQRKSFWFVFSPNSARWIQIKSFTGIIECRSQFSFWGNLLLFRICQSPCSFRDRWVVFLGLHLFHFLHNTTLLNWPMRKRFPFGADWTSMGIYILINITLSWTWNFEITRGKSLNHWLKLSSAGGVDFNDDALTIGDCFNIGFDEGLGNLIVAGAWAFFIVGFQKWSSSAGTLEGSTVFPHLVGFVFEVLARPEWVHGFGYFVKLSCSFTHECH